MVCNSNCVMRHGHDAGADFFFRINDDSEMKQTQNWITMFVDALAAFDPPNIGVVGYGSFRHCFGHFLNGVLGSEPPYTHRAIPYVVPVAYRMLSGTCNPML